MSRSSLLNVPDPALRGTGVSAWVPLPGAGRSFVRRDWREAFAGSGLHEEKDFFSVIGETLSKPGLGQRYRARLHLQKEGAMQTVYLKRFSGETVPARARRWLETGHWQTAAEHEVRVSIELAQEEIAVAQPLAWGSKSGGGSGRDSFVVLAAAPGQSVHEWLRRVPAEWRQANWRWKCRWVEALAALVRRFHVHGWRHRDLYLSHFFMDQREDELMFTLIDLQRIFRPRWRKERWRVKDLAQLNYSAGSQFSRAMRMRFARHYLGGGKRIGPHKSLLRKIQRKTNGIARRSRA